MKGALLAQSGAIMGSLLLLAGCASTSDVPSQVDRISFDKGTVLVHFLDEHNKVAQSAMRAGDNARVSYRPQGRCQPEIAVTQSGNQWQFQHVKGCFGEGDNQGTVFDVWLDASEDYLLSLEAGQMTVYGIKGQPQLAKVHVSVDVGGIHGGGREVERTALLGANGVITNSDGAPGSSLWLHVDLGGIDLVNKL